MKPRPTPWLLAALAVSAVACTRPLPSHAPAAPPATAVQPAPVPPLGTFGATPQWSGDGSRLFVRYREGFELRDGATGLVLAQRLDPRRVIKSQVSLDGSWVALQFQQELELRRGVDLSVLSTLPTSYNGSVQFVFSPDGSKLAVLDERGPLQEISTADGRVSWRFEQRVPSGATLGYVGEALVLGNRFGHEPPLVFKNHQPTDATWLSKLGFYRENADGSRLLFGEGEAWSVWDVAKARAIPLSRAFKSLPDWFGPYLGAYGETNTFVLTSPDQHTPPFTVPYPASAAIVGTPDGRYLRWTQGAWITEWDLARNTWRRLAWGQPPAPELQPGGLVLETEHASLTLRRRDDRSVVAHLKFHDESAYGWASPRGELAGLDIRSRSDMRLRIVGGGQPERSMLADGNTSIGAFDPEQPRLAVRREDRLEIRDSRTLELLRTFPGPTVGLSLKFLPHQNQLIVSYDDGTLTCFDLGTGRVVATTKLGQIYSELKVSPDGRRAAGLRYDHSVAIWSSAGIASLPATEAPRDLAFSSDSRRLFVLSEQELITYDVSSLSVVERKALTGGQLIFDENKLIGRYNAVRTVNDPRWQTLEQPGTSQLRLLGFRDGALVAYSRKGALLRWPIGAAAMTKVQRVTSADSALLSPDGSILSLEDRGMLDLDSDGTIGGRAVTAWSLDGRAAVVDNRVVTSRPSPQQPVFQMAGTLAFAGNAQSVLVSGEHDVSLVDLDAPSTPRTLARDARLAAQSADQLTIALLAAHDHRLSILRSPAWLPLGAPLSLNGAQQVALSDDGSLLAILDDKNELEVRRVSSSGLGERVLRRRVGAAPGVSRLLFDATKRFLWLEGTPVGVLRLSDGEWLNLYVGHLNQIDHVDAPLLFVDTRGQMFGDSSLAHVLYCESAAEPKLGTAATPCTLPRVTPDLVTRFFAP